MRSRLGLVVLFLGLSLEGFAAETSSHVVAAGTNSWAVVRAGEPVTVSAELVPGVDKGASYAVWIAHAESPKAFSENRADRKIRIDYLEANVTSIARGVSGTAYALETTGFEPGDYVGTIECRQKLYKFPFQVLPSGGERKAPQSQRTSDGIVWSLANDDDFLTFAATVPKGKNACLFIDPQGKGLTVYRLAFNAAGRQGSARATDNNMGGDSFVLDRTWRSGAVVKTSASGDTWTLEAKIPFGAFSDVPAAASSDWGVFVGTSEKVTGAKTYPRQTIAFSAKGVQAYELQSLKTKSERTPDGLALRVTGRLVNKTGTFRAQRLVATLETAGGEKLDDYVCVRHTRGSGSGTVASVDVPLASGKVGNGDAVILWIRSYALNGALKFQHRLPVRVEYNPISVKMTEPCYRDCVFASMKLNRLAGDVFAEEGFGKPLTVTLEGPGTKESFRIASLKPTNSFTFAFREKADGDYFIKAGRAVRRIRKLPFRKGEFWIDAKGVVRREGKVFFPWGYYSENYRSVYRGVSISQLYHDSIHTVEDFCSYLDKAKAHGCELVVSPAQPVDGAPFRGGALKGDFDTPADGPGREAMLRKLAAAALENGGLFAYYLADEPEGWGCNPDFLRRMHEILADADPYHPTMVCNYAYGAIGKFAAHADISCPDHYPIYLLGGRTLAPRKSSYGFAKAAARTGKCPMFAPQAFDWNYNVPGSTTRGPTYDEFREQVMMAFAGGTKGFLLYSRVSGAMPEWDLRLGAELVRREIDEQLDILLGDSESVELREPQKEKDDVIVVLKRGDRRTGLIAINTTGKPYPVSFSAKNLPRMLYRADGKEPLKVAAGGQITFMLNANETVFFSDRSVKFSVEAGRQEIARREAARRKPGNLAVAPRFLTSQELTFIGRGKKQFEGYPRLSTSSSANLQYSYPGEYFLQDGIDEPFPYAHSHCWKPTDTDADPSVTLEFGTEQKVRRVVVTRVIDEKKEFPVKRVALEIGGKTVAEADFDAGHRATFEISETVCDKLTVRVTKFDRAVKCGWLAEVEAY